MKTYILLYYLIINILSFILYGIDKSKAKHKKYRISEFTLLLMAFLGGGIGALFGMLIFHHKTKHMKFKILVPFYILLHIGGLLWILY